MLPSIHALGWKVYDTMSAIDAIAAIGNTGTRPTWNGV